MPQIAGLSNTGNNVKQVKNPRINVKILITIHMLNCGIAVQTTCSILSHLISYMIFVQFQWKKGERYPE